MRLMGALRGRAGSDVKGRMLGDGWDRMTFQRLCDRHARKVEVKHLAMLHDVIDFRVRCGGLRRSNVSLTGHGHIFRGAGSDCQGTLTVGMARITRFRYSLVAESTVWRRSR